MQYNKQRQAKITQELAEICSELWACSCRLCRLSKRLRQLDEERVAAAWISNMVVERCQLTLMPTPLRAGSALG